MSDQNTQGRLSIKENGDANSYALLDESGNWLLSVLHNGEELTSIQRETMRRFAACWNACEGISTDELEEIASTGGMLGPREGVARIAKQRDELLEALEALVCYDSYSTEYDGRMYDICPSCGAQDGEHKAHCEFLFARAAIAKAAGEQA